MEPVFAAISIFSGIFGGSLAVYGAIRADLARAIAQAEAAEKSADKAHKRIDNLILKGN